MTSVQQSDEQSDEESGRREPDETDGLRASEQSVDEAYERTLDEGEQRLSRGWRELISTGLIGGVDIVIGVLALLGVEAQTHNPLLGGLAFSIGFLALLLAHSELFTEGFLLPVAPVVAKRKSWQSLARLWVTVLLCNLVAGWLSTWLVMTAFPELGDTAIKSASHFVSSPLDAKSFCLAVLAGTVMTLMTRMQHGTEEMVGKIAAAVGAAFLLVGMKLFHSVLDSLLIFAALHTGRSPFGYADWLQWVWYTILGNMVGGIGLVTLLRLARNTPRLKKERATQTPD